MKMTDINNLFRFINTLPWFEIKDLFVEGNRVHDYKAITYKGTNKVVAIVTNKYNLVQHQQVFEFVINKLSKEYGQDNLQGWVEHYKTRAYLFITFKQINIQNDSDYRLGLLVTNSVDGTLSIWTTLFVYRIICQNGIIQKHNLLTIQNKHLGTSNLWSRLESRINTVLQVFDNVVTQEFETYERMKNVYANSVEVVGKLRKEIGMGKRAYYTILRNVKSTDSLFNILQAITNYYSNTRALNITSRVNAIRKGYNVVLSYLK